MLRLGRKKKRARGALFFSIIDILMGIPSGSLCGGERISCVHENHISSLPNLTYQTAQSNLIALIISYHLRDPGGGHPLHNTGKERWKIFSTMRKALWYE